MELAGDERPSLSPLTVLSGQCRTFLSISYCGSWTGGGPANNWLAAHNVVYDSYVETNAVDGHHKMEGTGFPKAAALYKSLWG